MMDEIHCPDCGSIRCIPWDDGWLCRCCGTEFDVPQPEEDFSESETNMKD